MKNENITINVPKDASYLSEVINELPTRCILNKGITGCGGTTVEIKSLRKSIILSPTINLVYSKSEQENIFGLTGDVGSNLLEKYIEETKLPKIIATYDALPRLIKTIGDKIYNEYYLLIDEYHILFNSYSFRRDTIRFILNEYSKFENFCFMTATPLKDGKILKELEHLQIVTYNWEKATPVNVSIRDKAFLKKELLFEISKAKDYNLHIFVNSIKFIRSVTKELKHIPFRTICSKESGKNNPNINPQTITSEVKKINFYTSAAFEGCDIYDEKGYSIIVSDSNRAQTLLDISTLVIQICGRIRNSLYKDEVLMILNTRNHRYYNYSNSNIFMENVKQNERQGKEREYNFISGSKDHQNSELTTYSDEKYNQIYLIKEGYNIIYDVNLKNMDVENYKIISSIYNSTINVIKEVNTTKALQTKEIDMEGYNLLEPMRKYTYDEIVNLFEPTLKEKGININKTTIGKYVSNITNKKRITIKGKKITVYIKK